MLSEAMLKLSASLSCVSYRGDQHTHILIEETDASAKLKKVTLKAPNGDWFAFSPDNGRGKKAQMSPLLAVGKEHDHHRACDCVIFVIKEAKCIILYMDLKSDNPVGYSGQFKSTRQFVRYAFGLLEEFHGEKIIIDEERYIVLYGGKKMLLDMQASFPRNLKRGGSKFDAAFKREVANDATLYLKEFLG